MKKNPAILQSIYSIPVVYEEAEEGGYIAYAPTLPGCHSQGETLEEAEKNIREAIELYFEVLAEEQDLPQPAKVFSGTIQISIPSYV